MRGGADPDDARDLARRALHRPHHRLPVDRRQEHRRRRRLDRLDRRRRPAARRAAERRRGSRARLPTGAAATRPTVTDACVVLGYLDPERLPRRRDAPRRRRARRRRSSATSRTPLGLPLADAASAILALATEQMVQAIAEITIDRGVDPRGAVLIGGGGAAGLNGVAVMRRLGCRALIVPGGRRRAERGRGADGRPLGRVRRGRCSPRPTTSTTPPPTPRSPSSRRRCEQFAQRVGAGTGARSSWSPRRGSRGRSGRSTCRCAASASPAIRPPSPSCSATSTRLHDEIFAVRDDGSAVDVVALRARVRCPVCARGRAGAAHRRRGRAAGRPPRGLLPRPRARRGDVGGASRMAFDEPLAGPGDRRVAVHDRRDRARHERARARAAAAS